MTIMHLLIQAFTIFPKLNNILQSQPLWPRSSWDLVPQTLTSYQKFHAVKFAPNRGGDFKVFKETSVRCKSFRDGDSLCSSDEDLHLFLMM